MWPGLWISAAGAAGDLTRSLEARETRVVVAVGSRALAELRARRTALPVVATMVLRGAQPEGAGQIDLDVPLGAQLAAVRELLPRASRAGSSATRTVRASPPRRWKARGARRASPWWWRIATGRAGCSK